MNTATLHTNTEQLWEAIRILPFDDMYFLKMRIEKAFLSAHAHQSVTNKLLHGPTMSDEQFHDYQQLTEDFAQWTKPL